MKFTRRAVLRILAQALVPSSTLVNLGSLTPAAAAPGDQPVPTGPWQIDGSGSNERDLTLARLQAVRRFLIDRGVEPKRIFVESRIDAKATEPRLDVQLVGQPSTN